MRTEKEGRISWFDALVSTMEERRMLLVDSQHGAMLVDTWPLSEQGESGKLRYLVGTIRGFAEAHWRNIITQIAPQRPTAHRPWTIGQADFVIAVMTMFARPATLSKRMRGDLKTLLYRIYNQRPDFDDDAILGLAGIHCFTLATRHRLVQAPPAPHAPSNDAVGQA